MSTEGIDYMAVLADLEAKRDALNSAIEAIRLMAGHSLPGAAVSATSAIAEPVMDTREIPTGAFHSMSIPAAARKFLAAVKRKQSTRQIAEALKKGGIHSEAENFTNTVYTALGRHPDIVRIGKDWALGEWHPGLGKVAKPPVPTKRGRKRGRSRKGASPSAIKNDETPAKRKITLAEGLHDFDDVETESAKVESAFAS